MLLPDWPQNSSTWEAMDPVLAESYTVIAPDLRGMGMSSRASVTGGAIPRCGHWMGEERPDYTAGEILTFFAGVVGRSDTARVVV